eukprot:767083-Hanusia_phi.AAC.11
MHVRARDSKGMEEGWGQRGYGNVVCPARRPREVVQLHLLPSSRSSRLGAARAVSAVTPGVLLF